MSSRPFMPAFAPAGAAVATGAVFPSAMNRSSRERSPALCHLSSRLLREAELDDAIEAAGGGRHELRHRPRLPVRIAAMTPPGSPRKTPLPRDHLVEHRPEGEHVGAGVDLLPLELLRRHVLDGADHGALGRQAPARRVGVDVISPTSPAADRFREPEVEELHARPREHHVAGLQVAMDDPLPVRRVQGVGDLRADSQRLIERERPSRAARPASRPRASSMTNSRIAVLGRCRRGCRCAGG